MIKSILELTKSGNLTFDSIGANRFMDFYDSLNWVFQKLDKAFHKTGLERDLDFFLYANRLLIGIIDYGLRTHKNILGLKHSIENLCLYSYRGDYQSSRDVYDELSLPKEILNSLVIENKDRISWASFDPKIVRKLIRKVRPKKIKDHIPDYLVLDGHDAYRPGLMLASKFDLMKICAIRNAQDSKRDSCPRPLEGETRFLRAHLYNKDILIMGEDFSTGKALNSIYEFIVSVSRPRIIRTSASIFIPGDPVLINLDYYGEKRHFFD